MKIFVLILAILLVFPATSQLYVTFESNNFVELESNNLNITFYKNIPAINVTYNGTSTIFSFTFLSTSKGEIYYFKNLNWSIWFNTSYYYGNIVNFTMKCTCENYSVSFNFIIPENLSAYSYSQGIILPKGIKNAIIVEGKISGIRENSIALGETISKNMQENFTGLDKLTPVESTPYHRINLTKSLSFYLVGNNGYQYFIQNNKNYSELINVLPFSSGNASYLSFISLPSGIFQGGEYGFEFLYLILGSSVGIIIIFMGIYYLRKRSS